jgi:hypothetical protein
MAAISYIIQGRNIPLYQYSTIHPFLLKEEHIEMIKVIEHSFPIWISTEENPMFHFIFEEKGMQPILFDLLTDTTAYQLYFDTFMPSNNDKLLLLLKVYLYERTYHKTLDSIGFINLSSGLIVYYKVTFTIREQIVQLWKFLQTKFCLYSAECHDSI